MNNHDTDVRNRSHTLTPANGRPDRRVVRTRRALGDALMRLLLERDLESITVQDILDASGVGRATFYGHYRGKQDLLLSHFESVMEWLHTKLQRDPPDSRRVVPVAEFCVHLAEAQRSISAIASSGQIDSLWDLGRSHLTAMIEGRLALLCPGLDQSRPRLALASRFCSGALVELLKWWLWRADRPTPQEMDAVFHDMVWNGCLGAADMAVFTTQAGIPVGARQRTPSD